MESEDGVRLMRFEHDRIKILKTHRAGAPLEASGLMPTEAFEAQAVEGDDQEARRTRAVEKSRTAKGRVNCRGGCVHYTHPPAALFLTSQAFSDPTAAH
jgi:hypothetical protein